MYTRNILLILISGVLFMGCAVSNNYLPAKKFAREELQQDYTLLRNILEKKHPALYWYTSKDSMDYYFDSLQNKIADSMTELQFGWRILAPLTQKIHCGHTSFGMSKNWGRFIKGRRLPSFPLYLKLWSDTMVVTGNLHRKDSLLKRGTVVTSVNGIRSANLIQQMFNYLPQDGYANNVNYTRLSSNFPYYHRNIFGIYKNYRVGYLDGNGVEQNTLVPMFSPVPDTTNKKVTKEKRIKPPRVPRRVRKKGRLADSRSLEIDTTNHTATLSLHTFSNSDGLRLRSFLRRSFKQLHQQQVKHLIIDLRSNGGGDVAMYVNLTRYIRNSPFKVADSSYAVSRNLAPYSGNFRWSLFKNIGLYFITKKQRDGNYHFGYWERHLYRPYQRHHFDGKVYVLTNGPTFSAATLFCNAVKGQQNVVLAGEETGGGWHGNSGIMIPDITLPITKLRVRLPLFKLVQFNHVPRNGRGVLPDIYIPPTVEGVKNNVDRKMEIVKELIRQSAAPANISTASEN